MTWTDKNTTNNGDIFVSLEMNTSIIHIKGQVQINQPHQVSSLCEEKATNNTTGEYENW